LESVPATHCADLLTARENLRCCNVRSYQKKCDKALYYPRPTAAHLAPFILLSSGRCLAPRQSCEIFRQVAIRQKSGRASQEQIPCWFCAVDMRVLRSTAHTPEAIAVNIRSCRSFAGDLQFRSRIARSDLSRPDVRMSGVADNCARLGLSGLLFLFGPRGGLSDCPI
jgi:hypothetical protein